MTAIELRFSSHIHDRFLADARRFAAAVHALTVHDRRHRAGALARWGHGFVAELGRHRRVEHRVIFRDFALRVDRAAPVVERLGELDASVVESLVALGPAIDRLFSPVVSFAVARAEVERLAGALVDALERHVVVEEQELLPLLERAYSVADYAHLMRCVEAFSPSTADPFTLAWTLDGADAEQLAQVVGALTRRDRVRLAWRRRSYRRMTATAFVRCDPKADVLARREFALAA